MHKRKSNCLTGVKHDLIMYVISCFTGVLVVSSTVRRCMKLVSHNVIYRGSRNSSAASCCFPAITRLPSGTMVSTWRIGSRKDSSDGKLLISRSNDGGNLWSAAEEFPLGPYTALAGEAHYGALTTLGPDHLLATVMWFDRSSPELPLFHPQTEGLLPTSTLFCESRDGGRTWDDYRELDHMPYDSPMPVTGPVLVLADGRLACQFEVNKNYESLEPWRHAAAWKISSDGGKTWPDCVEVAHDPTLRFMYWDARYAVRADGFCLAAFWTYDRQRQRDATIHLCHSLDYGRTWSRPRDTGIVGQICQPLIQSDGRLLLIYVDRFVTRSIRAVLSDDLGGTFHSDTVVYQHSVPQQERGEGSSAVNYLQEMDVWTFGRVEGVAEPDGRVSVVFYAGDSSATSIYWAQLSTDVSTKSRIDGAEVARPAHAPRVQQAKPHL